MKQTIELTLIGYNPDEFFPVYREGKIDNRGEFLAYKAKKAGIRVAAALDRAYFALGGQTRV